MRTSNVLGMEIQAATLDGAVNTVCRYLPKLRGKYVTFVNVHSLVMAKEDERYRRVQKKAAICFADGHPIAAWQKKHGHPFAERVAGPDFMERIFEKSEKEGYTHYFYGSTPQTLKNLQKNLKKKYPKLQIVGAYAPDGDIHVAEGDFTDDYACINKLHPDFIWIGLGAPKQELWMAKACGQINGVMLGVGAGFDFHAGTRKRAPGWMQKAGLEWFYRMVQEPKRLTGRYIRTNLKFVMMCIKEKLCR